MELENMYQFLCNFSNVASWKFEMAYVVGIMFTLDSSARLPIDKGDKGMVKFRDLILRLFESRFIRHQFWASSCHSLREYKLSDRQRHNLRGSSSGRKEGMKNKGREGERR